MHKFPHTGTWQIPISKHAQHPSRGSFQDTTDGSSFLCTGSTVQIVCNTKDNRKSVAWFKNGIEASGVQLDIDTDLEGPKVQSVVTKRTDKSGGSPFIITVSLTNSLEGGNVIACGKLGTEFHHIASNKLTYICKYGTRLEPIMLYANKIAHYSILFS